MRGLVLTAGAAASGVPWLSGYTYRKKITTQFTNVDSALTDFPLYVPFSNDADLAAALATGYDIRFTQSDGETLLKYERESWSGGGGSNVTADFWVKVPSISAVAGTDIYIYYGKTGDSDGEDASNVWDSNFAAVYHLKEDGGTYYDSTSNNCDDDGSGTDPTRGTGKVGYGQDFEDGSSEYIDCGNPSALQITGKAITVEAWLKGESYTNWQALLGKSDVGNNDWNEGWGFYWYSNELEFYCNDYAAGNAHIGLTDTASWHYAVGYYDGSSVEIDLDNTTGTGQLLSANITDGDTFAIGRLGGHTDYWDGLVDEVRISEYTRPAEWRKFTYHNIAEADNELTIGSEEEGLVDYDLVCAQGSFTLTGQAVGLEAARSLACSQGSFTLTGQAMTPKAARSLTCGAGSFVLTGQAVGVEAARSLTCGQGSFALTGQAAGLVIARTLTASYGGFVLSGQAVALLRAATLTAAAGTFTLTGQAVTLRRGRVLEVGFGAFTLSGQAVTLSYTFTPETSWEIVAGEVFAAGGVAGEVYLAGAATSEVFCAGGVAGEIGG